MLPVKQSPDGSKHKNGQFCCIVCNAVSALAPSPASMNCRLAEVISVIMHRRFDSCHVTLVSAQPGVVAISNAKTQGSTPQFNMVLDCLPHHQIIGPDSLECSVRCTITVKSLAVELEIDRSRDNTASVFSQDDKAEFRRYDVLMDPSKIL